MNKTQLKKTLRDMAAKCAIARSPKAPKAAVNSMARSLYEYEKELEKEGINVKAENYYGMRGLVAYEGIKTCGMFAAFPKNVQLGKKPRVIVYELSDVVTADILDAELANAKTRHEVDEIAQQASERIQSASLLNSLYEGIEQIWQELPEEPPQDKPMKNERTPEELKEDWRELCHYVQLYMNGEAEPSKWKGCTFTQKNMNSCVWISGNTKPYKEELKAAGYRWSKKRKAWYMKPFAA